MAGYSLAVRFSLSALEPLAFTQMILPGLQIHIINHFDLTCRNQPAWTVFCIDLGWSAVGALSPKVWSWKHERWAAAQLVCSYERLVMVHFLCASCNTGMDFLKREEKEQEVEGEETTVPPELEIMPRMAEYS